MKIRLHSPALVARYGETCDMKAEQALGYIRAGVATSMEKAEKKTTVSKKKTKAENTSASD